MTVSIFVYILVLITQFCIANCFLIGLNLKGCWLIGNAQVVQNISFCLLLVTRYHHHYPIGGGHCIKLYQKFYWMSKFNFIKVLKKWKYWRYRIFKYRVSPKIVLYFLRTFSILYYVVDPGDLNALTKQRRKML